MKEYAIGTTVILLETAAILGLLRAYRKKGELDGYKEGYYKGYIDCMDSYEHRLERIEEGLKEINK